MLPNKPCGVPDLHGRQLTRRGLHYGNERACWGRPNRWRDRPDRGTGCGPVALPRYGSVAVSRGALFGSLALILGAIAGWFGGRTGTVYPTLTDLNLASAAHTSSAPGVERG